MRPCRLSLCTVLLLATATPVGAAGDSPSPCAITDPDAACLERAEEVIVTAGREEQRRFEACRSIGLVDEVQIQEDQAQSLPEAVSRATGVYLQQTNRGAGAPFIRGLVGPQNLVLIDGVPFNTATFRTGPNQYLALIDPFALDRVEVVRGPSSVLYGSGAMGGVIQAIAAEPSDRPGAGGLGRVQSRQATADTSHGFSLRLDPDPLADRSRLALRLGASYDHYGILRAGGGARQPNSDYQAAAWQAMLRYRPAPAWTLRATYLGMSMQNAGRMDRAGNGDLRFYDNLDHLVYLRLRREGRDWFRGLEATISYHRLEEMVRRQSCPTADDGVVADLGGCLAQEPEQIVRRRRYRDLVDVLGGDVNTALDFFERRLRLKAGLAFYQEFVGSSLASASAATAYRFEDGGRGNFSDGSRYRTLGLFAQAEATVWRIAEAVGELRLTGGLRFSHFGASAPDVPGYGDVAYDYNGAVGSAGLQLLRPGWYNLYFSFVQGFRAPNLQETTNVGDTGQKFSIPNPDLRPERTDALELGGRFQAGPIQAGLAWYYAFDRDAVSWQAATYQGQTEVDGKPVTQLVNTTEGLHQGVEGELALELWRFALLAQVTWSYGREEGGDGSQPARWIPPLFGRTELRYRHPGGGVWIALALAWFGRKDRLHPLDRTDSRICQTAPYSGLIADPCPGSASWATLDLRAGTILHPGVQLTLALNNLADAHHRLHASGFDQPGLDARLRLTADF